MNEAFPIDLLRSLLFVPVLQNTFGANAATRGADAIILDLEDSIEPDAKERARGELASATTSVRAGQVPVFVRVNSTPADALEQDVTAALNAGVDGILVPKVETGANLEVVERIIEGAGHGQETRNPALTVLATIETPLGLVNAPWLAKAGPRLKALLFGSEDFAAAMVVAPHENAMTLPAQQLAIAAKSQGLAALGLPGSIAIIEDQERFRRIAANARSIGMSGSPCIHPNQVRIANEVFGVSPEEVEEASAIKRAYEEALAKHNGAVSLNGRMIDVPVYERAVAVLRRSAAQRNSVADRADDRK